MNELPLPYLNAIASQLIFICSFLGGFSATILGTLILAKGDQKMLKYLIVGSSSAAISFIVAVFSMTQVYLYTLPEVPFEMSYERGQIVGFIAFYLGMLSLMFVLSASGWMHSKKVGIITSILGVIGLILMIMATTS